MINGFQRWRSLGRVLLFFVVCAVVLATIAPLAPKGPRELQELFIGTMASLGAFGLTVLFIRWEGLRPDDIGASPDRWSLLRFSLGFLIGLFLVALHSAIAWSAGHVQWVRSSETGSRDAVVTLIAYLSLSVREELAFHGYPLQRLKSSFGLWRAQFIAAFVFALEHVAGGSTWRQALFGAGIGSLLFGMAAIATRGLALPIGLHAAWNFGDWMRGGKGSMGFWKPVVEDSLKEWSAFAGMTSYVLIMCSATLAFWWWHCSIETNKLRRA